MDWCEHFGGPQAVKEIAKLRTLTIAQVDEEALLIHSQLARWHKVSADWILRKFFRCLLAVATLEKMGFVASEDHRQKRDRRSRRGASGGPSSSSSQHQEHLERQNHLWPEISEVVHCFYCVCVPDVLSMLVNEPLRRAGTDESASETTSSANTATAPTPPSTTFSSNPSEILLYCLALLLDISKFLLNSLGRTQISGDRVSRAVGGRGSEDDGEDEDEDRVGDAVAILRALCVALNRETLFHKQRKYEILPVSILCHAHNCTKSALVVAEMPIAASAPPENKEQASQASGTPAAKSEISSAAAVARSVVSRSRIQDSNPTRRRKGGDRRKGQQLMHCYRWITVLWESFGGNRIWNAKSYSGYDALRELLPHLHRYDLELNEAVLHFLCRALEFSRDDQMSSFVAPCFQYFMQIARRICEEPLHLSSTGRIFLILEHIKYLSCVFGTLLPRDMERCISGFVSKVQKRVRKEIMAQLS